ncbi:hypothetical protein [Streptomyces sp. CB03238]|uniref:hypothetical protein n=1 Tax=Streptomyces sp. CB03238 TaxID=1907777 RepID=UPI000A109C60|nr:hypothetical protein [Streptomyces sp. CB03238]ORT59293.1 hypothetical protein BKD26_14990 [Streptomyces sp. CB03238]
MHKRALQLVPEGTHTADKTRRRIRAHDAWALELPVLLDTMNARAVEMDLGQHGIQAALTVLSGRLCVLVRPGLSERQLSVGIRSLLARYIHRPAPLLLLWPEPDGQGVVVKEPDDVSDMALEDPPDVTAEVLHLYGDGNWAPKDGWRSDDEVLKELLKLADIYLKGVVEDIPEEMYPLPDGLGAVAAAGYDSEGLAHPLVFIRGDLPVGLRVDLLGFCLALAVGAEYADREPDENGLFYVGTEAGPVCGPGAALLGALMVQRLGRRPGDCAFRLLDPPEEIAPWLEPAA